MAKVLSFLVVVALITAFVLCPFKAIAEEIARTGDKPVLKFNSDGKFRILMINDTQDTDKMLKDTSLLIENALDKTNPDLVVLVGDNIAGYWLGVNKEKVEKAIDNVVRPINKRGIPFAVVFGNHDQESGISKEDQMKMYMSYNNCLAVDEGEAISNCGTYNLLISERAGEKPVFNLWMIDSGTSASEGGYQCVNDDQINWYEKTSEELRAANGGKPLPSLLFQHIPVPEIYGLLKTMPEGAEGAVKGHRTQSENYYLLDNDVACGNMLEAPCSPDKNSGQFASWLKQKDILGAYFGHDHVNDFMGKVQGIDLGYSPGSGFYQYGNGVLRGVRTFDLDESDLENYKTKVLYYKDLVASKAGISIFDASFNSKLRIAIPVLLTAINIFLLISLFVIAVVKKVRKTKTKPIA